jgi:hypothetical protein
MLGQAQKGVLVTEAIALNSWVGALVAERLEWFVLDQGL